VRETLFNWLGQDLTDKRCLDLFAGSGALGIEAASRGASEVVMVESNRSVYQSLQVNIQKLQLTTVALRNEDALNFSKRNNEQFDVIFLDPPFKSDYLEKLLPLLSVQLAPKGLLYIESGSAIDAGEDWQVYKQGRAGAVHYQLLEIIQND